MENKYVFNESSFQRMEKKQKDLGAVYRRSLWKDIKKEIRANKLAMFAVIFLVIIITACLLAPLSPYDPNGLSRADKFAPASLQHPFGCDEFGRDYFTRALYGGRISLLVGFSAMFVTVCIGTTIGIFSGYIGGKFDMLLMRFTDIFLALPSMLLMIVLNSFLKPSIPTLIAVLSLFSWASVARITRAETMSLKERDYVVASKNLGAGNIQIAVKHILPNILGPVMVAASLGVASAILSESSLSFLGLGISIPHASWGSMLQGAQAFILDRPILAVYPGVLILLTVLSFNILGDVLRSALEPKIVK
ncbi:MAG: ABC transporter permease [Clostridia bacterium]|nr:ABC transporter permease [Clostridia bacterium]MBQ9925823.1 ABC transporter permease [Clostridia bacterium]